MATALFRSAAQVIARNPGQLRALGALDTQRRQLADLHPASDQVKSDLGKLTTRVYFTPDTVFVKGSQPGTHTIQPPATFFFPADTTGSLNDPRTLGWHSTPEDAHDHMAADVPTDQIKERMGRLVILKPDAPVTNLSRLGWK